MGLVRTIVYIALLYMILSTILNAWIANKSYKFKVGAVSKLGKANSGGYFNYDNLYEDLMTRFPEIIYNNDEFPWISLSTGHLSGKVKLLYTSLTEMLIVYHTTFDTTGQSGRHYMNMSITVLKGQVSMSHEVSMTPTVFHEGDVYVHRYGEATQLQFKEDSYILIYARGFVPLSLFYWIFDSLFSTFDLITILMVLFYFIKAFIFSLNLLQSALYVWDCIWKYINLGFGSYYPWIKDWFYHVICKMF